MKILAIETSCDETAVAIVEAKKLRNGSSFTILGNSLYSQIKIHEQYGGVFPMIAKREHAKTLTYLLENSLKEAHELKNKKTEIAEEKKIRKILEREEGLADELIGFLKNNKKPKIDLIAVTNGPGLEPALWVGVNFAKALSIAWDIPVIPINHMEGHLLSSLLEKKANASSKLKVESKKFEIRKPKFPLLGLLISGGHTELVLMKDFGKYKIIGKTRDDAVGEAFDKVARMLNLPYPGGPQISKLAEEARQSNFTSEVTLPRPMLHSSDYDFSYAGLKTAVLYLLKKIPNVDEKTKMSIALEFENAAAETLIGKTRRAIQNTHPSILTIGGGVSANKHIQREFKKLVDQEFKDIELLIPEKILTTDNAVMIALTAFFKFNKNKKYSKAFKASGNLSL